jgi:hypothetical protein
MFIGYGTVVENTAWFPWLALECATVRKRLHTQESKRSQMTRGLLVLACVLLLCPLTTVAGLSSRPRRLLQDAAGTKHACGLL